MIKLSCGPSDDSVVQSKAAYGDTDRPDAQPANEAGELKPESAALFAALPSHTAPSPNWLNLATGQPDVPVRKLMAMPPPPVIVRDLQQEKEQNLNRMLLLLHKPRRIYHW